MTSIAKQQGLQLVFPGATAIGVPLAIKITDFPRLRELQEFSQGRGEDLFMPLPITRGAEGATDRMVNENRSRRRHLGHDVQGGADDQRGNSRIFDDVGDETDGLMAKGSVGD